MLKKYKTEKLTIEGRTLMYREENNYYWAYCPKTIEFYKFNEQGFAILLGISEGLFDSKIALKMKKSESAQSFLHYLLEHQLCSEKYLKKINILLE